MRPELNMSDFKTFIDKLIVLIIKTLRIDYRLNYYYPFTID